MILAGDIGGTNTRLALYEKRGGHGPAALERVAKEKYPSKERGSLYEIVREFIGAHGAAGTSIEAAGFGIAGPVKHRRCEATNLPWVIDAAVLEKDLGLAEGKVELVNDLVANAYGIGGLEEGDFAVLHEGVPDPEGNQAVLAAGTGLGQAGLHRVGKRLYPVASEGGHATFAPRDDLEFELVRWLRKKHEHVSGEHVLSGPGLVNIYEFLRDTNHGSEPAWLREALAEGDKAATITRAALDRKEPLADATLDLFVSIYAHCASNAALMFLATGGIFLGGGIAPRIVGRLRTPEFVKSFLGPGRLRSLLEAVPVRVILNDGAALLGAARAAAWL